MQSARQRIKDAVTKCYEAYAEYSRVVYRIDVVPAKVRAISTPGRGEHSGWTINGRFYHLKSSIELEREFLECASQWQAALAEFHHEVSQ